MANKEFTNSAHYSERSDRGKMKSRLQRGFAQMCIRRGLRIADYDEIETCTQDSNLSWCLEMKWKLKDGK